MENILKENIKKNEEFLKLKYETNQNNIETLALIINELYYFEVANDIELKVIIQEESYGSLFTKPQFLMNTSSYPNIWLKKDINWMIEKVNSDKRHLRPHMTDDFDVLNYQKDLNWSDSTLNLFNHLTIIMDSYDWSHFTNIGRILNSPLWKAHQEQSKKDTNEHVWIASFSKENYINNLSLIAWNVNEADIKEVIIKREKERLEKELSHNTTPSKAKAKI